MSKLAIPIVIVVSILGLCLVWFGSSSADPMMSTTNTNQSGGWTERKFDETDDNDQLILKFLRNEADKKFSLSAEFFSFNQVITLRTQVVSGIKYDLTMSFIDSQKGLQKVVRGVVVFQSWKLKQSEKAALYLVSLEVTKQNKVKKIRNLAQANPEEVEELNFQRELLEKATEFALEELKKRHNIPKDQTVVTLLRKQLVSGLKYYFSVTSQSNSGGRREHLMHVWVQPWLDKYELTHCEEVVEIIESI